MSTNQMIKKALENPETYGETTNKLKCFLENAKELNNHFQIIPLLYGSLGLGIILETDLNPDDIDMLIPEIYLNEKWKEFQKYLEGIGYKLIDEHEHTFLKSGTKYAYASLENLEPFASISENEMETIMETDTCFKLLSLEQYLRVYEESSKDGYRMNQKEKKDTEKINLIQQKLSTK